MGQGIFSKANTELVETVYNAAYMQKPVPGAGIAILESRAEDKRVGALTIMEYAGSMPLRDASGGLTPHQVTLRISINERERKISTLLTAGQLSIAKSESGIDGNPEILVNAPSILLLYADSHHDYKPIAIVNTETNEGLHNKEADVALLLQHPVEYMRSSAIKRGLTLEERTLPTAPQHVPALTTPVVESSEVTYRIAAGRDGGEYKVAGAAQLTSLDAPDLYFRLADVSNIIAPRFGEKSHFKVQKRILAYIASNNTNGDVKNLENGEYIVTKSIVKAFLTSQGVQMPETNEIYREEAAVPEQNTSLVPEHTVPLQVHKILPSRRENTTIDKLIAQKIVSMPQAEGGKVVLYKHDKYAIPTVEDQFDNMVSRIVRNTLAEIHDQHYSDDARFTKSKGVRTVTGEALVEHLPDDLKNIVLLLERAEAKKRTITESQKEKSREIGQRIRDETMGRFYASGDISRHVDTPEGIVFEAESFYAKSPAVTRLEQLSGFDVRNRSGVRFVREIELHPTDYIILNAEARPVLRIQAFRGKRAYDIFPRDVHQYINVKGMERPAAPVMKSGTLPTVSIITNDKAPNVLATSDNGVKHPWSSALALVENEPGAAPAFCKWAVQRGIAAEEYITDDVVLTYIALPPEEKLALLR